MRLVEVQTGLASFELESAPATLAADLAIAAANVDLATANARMAEINAQILEATGPQQAQLQLEAARIRVASDTELLRQMELSFPAQQRLSELQAQLLEGQIGMQQYEQRRNAALASMAEAQAAQYPEELRVAREQMQQSINASIAEVARAQEMSDLDRQQVQLAAFMQYGVLPDDEGDVEALVRMVPGVDRPAELRTMGDGFFDRFVEEQQRNARLGVIAERAAEQGLMLGDQRLAAGEQALAAGEQASVLTGLEIERATYELSRIEVEDYYRDLATGTDVVSAAFQLGDMARLKELSGLMATGGASNPQLYALLEQSGITAAQLDGLVDQLSGRPGVRAVRSGC